MNIDRKALASRLELATQTVSFLAAIEKQTENSRDMFKATANLPVQPAVLEIPSHIKTTVNQLLKIICLVYGEDAVSPLVQLVIKEIAGMKIEDFNRLNSNLHQIVAQKIITLGKKELTKEERDQVGAIIYGLEVSIARNQLSKTAAFDRQILDKLRSHFAPSEVNPALEVRPFWNRVFIPRENLNLPENFSASEIYSGCLFDYNGTTIIIWWYQGSHLFRKDCYEKNKNSQVNHKTYYYINGKESQKLDVFNPKETQTPEEIYDFWEKNILDAIKKDLKVLYGLNGVGPNLALYKPLIPISLLIKNGLIDADPKLPQLVQLGLVHSESERMICFSNPNNSNLQKLAGQNDLPKMHCLLSAIKNYISNDVGENGQSKNYLQIIQEYYSSQFVRIVLFSNFENFQDSLIQMNAILKQTLRFISTITGISAEETYQTFIKQSKILNYLGLKIHNTHHSEEFAIIQVAHRKLATVAESIVGYDISFRKNFEASNFIECEQILVRASGLYLKEMKALLMLDEKVSLLDHMLPDLQEFLRIKSLHFRTELEKLYDKQINKIIGQKEKLKAEILGLQAEIKINTNTTWSPTDHINQTQEELQEWIKEEIRKIENLIKEKEKSIELLKTQISFIEKEWKKFQIAQHANEYI